MSDKNKRQEQNISDVLDMLKKSYSEDNSNMYSQNIEQDQNLDSNRAMSEDELKEKLRAEFMNSSNKFNDDADSVQDNSYSIDKSFFEENALETGIDVEILEKAEELKNVEEAEEVQELEELEELEEVEVVIEKSLSEDEGFEVEANTEATEEETQVVAEEYAEDIINKNLIVLEENADDDITFDEIEEIFDAENDIEMTTLDIDDDVSSEDITHFNTEETIGNSAYFEDNTIVYRTISTAKLVNMEEAEKENSENIVDENIALTTDDNNAVADDELYDEDMFDDIDYENAQSDSKIDNSAISLLMQFGCDDEVVEHFTKDSYQDASDDVEKEANTVLTEELTNKAKPKVDEKAKALYKKLLKKKKVTMIGSLYMAVMAVLLLLYEGLPLLGVTFPGIMNREEYYISHLLLGLQITVFCAIPCFKNMVNGVKQLMVLHPNGYSAAVLLGVSTLIYDIVAICSSDDSLPPTFHFALSCVFIFIYTLDLREIISDIKNFEFFYGKVIKLSINENFDSGNSNVDDSTTYTLYKSEGKRSTAEKMYAGGIDPAKNIYFPIEANSVSGFSNIINTKTGYNEFSILVFIFSLALSVIIGIIALILSSRIYIGFSSALVSLFVTMPIVFMQLTHLPYQCIVGKSKAEEYSFSSEESLDEFAHSDILIFKDLHLFKKVSSASINLALYDSTPKYVLLACLNAVYLQIGGPMAEVFSGGADSRFKQCNIVRVGKSGVQAVIGSNYSVLIGNEQFMTRYGITFPEAKLAREEDKAFTLCVSINGRASARFAVKYVVNEMFYNFADRLAEVNISCAVETFDPIVSTQMLSQLLPKASTPISIVHLNAIDLKERDGDRKAAILFEAAGAEATVLARTSKLNLAVALRTAKQVKKLKKLINVISAAFSGVCAATLLLLIFLGAFDLINGLLIGIYWLLAIGVPVGVILNLLPSKKAFLLDKYSKK